MSPLWLLGAGGLGLAWLSTRHKGLFAPSGQRIYLLGDSLSVGPSSPGGQLAKLLRQAGAIVEVNAIGGWTALQFMRERNADISADVRQLRPSIVLVFLGTNEEANIAAGGNAQALLGAHLALKRLFPGVQVILIGMPQVDPTVLIDGVRLSEVEPKVYEALRGIYGAQLVDTRSFAKPMKGNVHLDAKNAALFAQQTFSALTGEAPQLAAVHHAPHPSVLQWRPQVEAASHQTGIPVPLLFAVMEEESGGDPHAMSTFDFPPYHAYGLLQLTPPTAAQYGVSDIWDPAQNVLGGAQTLAAEFSRWGNWYDALASYNAGAGNVQKHGWQHFQGYVMGVLSRVHKYES